MLKVLAFIPLTPAHQRADGLITRIPLYLNAASSTYTGNNH